MNICVVSGRLWYALAVGNRTDQKKLAASSGYVDCLALFCARIQLHDVQ